MADLHERWHEGASGDAVPSQRGRVSTGSFDLQKVPKAWSWAFGAFEVTVPSKGHCEQSPGPRRRRQSSGGGLLTRRGGRLGRTPNTWPSLRGRSQPGLASGGLAAGQETRPDPAGDSRGHLGESGRLAPRPPPGSSPAAEARARRGHSRGRGPTS